MGKLLFLFLLAVSATGLGQNNSVPSAYLSRFTLSEVPRPLECQLSSDVTHGVALGISRSTGAEVSVPASTGQFQAETASEMQGRMDALCSRLERLELDGHLFHSPQTSDSPIVNALNDILEPEIIRIGKISAYATPITAWKRKNPLCLLSPAVVGFSW
jgi:hypothetical protein